jgi:hypothetical protein
VGGSRKHPERRAERSRGGHERRSEARASTHSET